MQSNMWLHNETCCARMYLEVRFVKFKDFILLIGIVVVALVEYVCIQKSSDEEAERVVVSVNGEIYGEYSLNEEQKIRINDTNVLLIKDKKADMIHGDCPDQICVEHKEISKTGESIVCLPNKIIVEVMGTGSSVLDAVTN